MSYDKAVLELRQLISDTEGRKIASNKKLIGAINGLNQKFVTFDKRIVKNTLEVFVNGSSVDFDVDDLSKGQITLKDPPSGNVKLTSNYAYQFWLDEELTNFLNKGAEACSLESTNTPDNAYLSIPGGLKMAALFIAASMALRSEITYLVNRRHSQEFNIEQDGNDENAFSQTIAEMRKLADSFHQDGITHRDDFYKRRGKREAPASAIKTVRLSRYGANR